MSSDHIQPIRELRYWQSINFTDNICIALVPRMTKSHFSTFSLAVFGCAFKRFEASKEHLGRSGRVVKSVACQRENKRKPEDPRFTSPPPPRPGKSFKKSCPVFWSWSWVPGFKYKSNSERKKAFHLLSQKNWAQQLKNTELGLFCSQLANILVGSQFGDFLFWWMLPITTKCLCVEKLEQCKSFVHFL